MTDVRLTALNPVDSQVYPVACNTSGELIVEQVDPGPDLTVTGDLTVNGTATFDSSITANGSAGVSGNVTSGSSTASGQFKVTSPASITPSGADAFLATHPAVGNGNAIQMKFDGSALFASNVTSLGNFQSDTTGAYNFLAASSGTTYLGIYASDKTIKMGNLSSSVYNITLDSTNGDASFAGDITCTDNTKGLILKSPNGTLYRITVANDGTLGTN